MALRQGGRQARRPGRRQFLQNLYLACERLGSHCAIGKYDQTELDKYLGLDGEDMFAMYAAIVGKPAKKE